MNTAEHISEDDLLSFALQFLPDKEMPDAVAHLSHCEACRAELGRIQGDLAAYALTAEPHSPPAYARERLLAQVAKDSKLLRARRGAAGPETATPTNQPVKVVKWDGPERMRSPFWGWAGWAVAAVLAIGAGWQATVNRHRQTELEDQLAAMSDESGRARAALKAMTDSRAVHVGMHLASADNGAAGHAPEALAAYMAETGSLVFVASHLAPLQPYKTYELWLLPANGRDPIAAGIFKPDEHGNANVVMPNLPKGVPASGFGVTIEDEGGAKQPTLPIVMSGS